MAEVDDSARARENPNGEPNRHPAFGPPQGGRPPDEPKIDDPRQDEVEWLRKVIGARAHTIAGKGWVRTIIGTDPVDALAVVLEQVAELHDLALSSERWWRDAKGVLHCEVRADVGSALECLRAIAQLASIKRDKDDLGNEDRRWASMSPDERAREMLADPMHGPLLRELVRQEDTK